ncbi:uncharacterized protein LOC133818178 isoform X1 [Humulus lupulus]|uniref:uncharacterized protein LOC133818178 isoform X1 n=1 Tax=Humulus lupulus TaxID=3486 RepID=UPI002B40E65C|nr:uncharacterized protein LOC133818178 isoform X1 [Humulus lupulus]XP_062106889.1 uncharacterized protein LOC133818178 isoform X1 [Humulus lupulus]
MQLEVQIDTTTLSYWLNWRVLLCSIWVFTPMVLALYIIWKYEEPHHLKSGTGEVEQSLDQSLCDNEAWRPSLKQIHPLWLLGFRLFAFFSLLTTLIFKIVISGATTFLYYTQLTFTLLTVYFGYGALLSIYGCYQYRLRNKKSNVSHFETNTGQGSYMPLISNDTERNTSNPKKDDCYMFQLPRIFTYVFEILFQMNAGAVMLTDSVFWIIIVPFLTIKDYNLTFMNVSLHSFNAILLLCDTALNCLQVPVFRITFFILWTGVFVIFQWIIHACVSFWWPYPFLELSSPYAPLWYLLVAVMHIPCYGLFVLIVKMKRFLLTKWFPLSCQC